MAASTILSGGIVVFPTETVYGIGASSYNFESCKKIYEIKNRPSDNPLIVHFPSIESIEKACHMNDRARKLFQELSPGAITIILKKKDERIFSNGLETLAVRIPSHPSILELLNKSGPISAPSANPSGKPSFTREEDVIREFSGKVDCILQAAAPTLGLESTVINLSSGDIVLLRPGSIDATVIEDVLGDKISRKISNSQISPGIKYRHYSPNAKMILVDSFEGFDFQELIEKEINSNKSKNKDELPISQNHFKVAKIGFRISKPTQFDRVVHQNTEYAYFLYEFLIDCDNQGIDLIFCERPMPGDLNETINNRLNKASSGV
ncbi:L-threonylcarbamoyladenylate synthase [Leptospira sp. GIMC2001]|nr:L-threonylcarbamoyladenylate synthase [Leptospira sp. GIMC2001]WCL51360.1 L-threonylcarbamoyladenylate synthase [Leptospira sp. GIMC2001]